MIAFLDEPKIAELLDMAALIEVEAAALAAFSRGEVIQPERTVLNAEAAGGFFLPMPAIGDAMG
ncbi:MAG: ornithine cyclodeaminase family protein, partial [Rhodospirillaceae bacterium]|nr:ornithine cyclodeaminase family protein [Rhodospirillaceae bacterium]